MFEKFRLLCKIGNRICRRTGSCFKVKWCKNYCFKCNVFRVSWIPEINSKCRCVAEVSKPQRLTLFRPELTSLHWPNPTSDRENQPVNSPLISLSHSAVCQSWFPSSSVCVVDYVQSSSSRHHQRQNCWAHVCWPELMSVDLFSICVWLRNKTYSADWCSTITNPQQSCILLL